MLTGSLARVFPVAEAAGETTNARWPVVVGYSGGRPGPAKGWSSVPDGSDQASFHAGATPQPSPGWHRDFETGNSLTPQAASHVSGR